MKKTLLILTAVASLTIPRYAHARLGWTLEECEKQYGDPTGDPTLGLSAHQGYQFHVGNYLLTIEFENGKASAIGYEFRPGTHSRFTQPVIADLIAKNTPGISWEEAKTTSDYTYRESTGNWVRDNLEYTTTQYSIREGVHPEIYSVQYFARKDIDNIYWLRITVKQQDQITPGL
jgi:hypothetical protein